MKNFKVACVIPTFNGVKDLNRLLLSLQAQTYPFDLFIIDSDSSDGTYELASQSEAKVFRIKSSDFNHGGTRQYMIDENPLYDLYLFLTQDAILYDQDSIRKLVDHFDDGDVGAVCGRQLPHSDANLFAQHARYYNYPENSVTKTVADSSLYGIRTPFMSNSYAAYRATAMTDVGGFPNHVILSEDMYVAAKMLLQGWKVSYAGDAKCRHSHNYSLKEEFCRYFDIGVFHSREPWIRQSFGGAGGEGLRFLKSEFKFIGVRRFYLWPSFFIRNILKFFAYKLGQHEKHIPLSLTKNFSMHKGFWQTK